jgi:hypothetical protein
MKKKIYEKPAMQVVILQHQVHLLAGSGEEPTDAPLWDGEAGARKHNSVWDDDWEEEF